MGDYKTKNEKYHTIKTLSGQILLISRIIDNLFHIISKFDFYMGCRHGHVSCINRC